MNLKDVRGHCHTLKHLLFFFFFFLIKLNKRQPQRVCSVLHTDKTFFLLRNFSVTISMSPHVCFILILILISLFLK